MNANNKNLPEPDDSKFIEELASYFKAEREQNLIKETVAAKVAATDFKKFNLKSSASPNKFRYIAPMIVIIAAISLVFFIYSLIESQNSGTDSNFDVNLLKAYSIANEIRRDSIQNAKAKLAASQAKDSLTDSAAIKIKKARQSNRIAITGEPPAKKKVVRKSVTPPNP